MLATQALCWLQYNDETFGYGIYGNGSSTPGQYNGVPSCANKGLLTDLARDEVSPRRCAAVAVLASMITYLCLQQQRKTDRATCGCFLDFCNSGGSMDILQQTA